MHPLSGKIAASLLLVVLAVPAVAAAQAASARSMYTAALGQERQLRDGDRAPSLAAIRKVIAAYERIVHRHPTSGYSDNALWQGANLSLLAYERFGQEADRRNGLRMLELLRTQYPSSSLVPRVNATVRLFEAARVAAAQPVPAATEKTPPAPPPAERAARAAPAATTGPAMIREIRRTPLPDGVRVSIELERESVFSHEPLEGPRRVFFDLQETRPSADLPDTLRFADGDVVREIRLGRHPNNTMRVVMDMEGAARYSVFTLYEPFRLVVDFERVAGAGPAATAAAAPGLPAANTGEVARPAPTTGPPASLQVAQPPAPQPPVASRRATDPVLPSPSVPSANSNGSFSIARQLGLGVSRIVIDPGHGGHDPGVRAHGVDEAEIVLDVALRLKRLLEKEPGIDVVMTRETDVFVPLEERTAIANRVEADLFLSIHANASRNPSASGVETYYLNFARTKEAEAVAARENSASARTMHSLPEIVRAITLNNKLNESRDFAGMVQESMVKRLSARNRNLQDRGVKQAPFVVLIGAGMPSVLAEISFVSNRQEAQLLKTAAYRQHIAEALFEAVQRYQRSLKRQSVVAANSR